MREGGSYAVMILLDYKTNRMIGTTKIGSFVKDIAENLEEGQEVKLVVWQKTDLGYKVIINNEFIGLVYNNEIFENINLGDNKTGYIKLIREDGKIDVTLQKQGYEAVTDVSDKVLQVIEKNGGIIPLGDKSSPEEIHSQFGISKKNFKKVLGGLYKSGKIEIFDFEVRLKKVEG